MTDRELLAMTQRIHDTEGYNLGTASTREQRNAFIEFVVGCAHWGHPRYNATPDPRWNCKDPDGQGGRPMSDDIAVSMPERLAFDLVVGSGADGYRIQLAEPFFLPVDQWVFAPSRPKGSIPEPQTPQAPPTPPPAPAPACDLSPALERLEALHRQIVGLALGVSDLRSRLDDALEAQEPAAPPSYEGRVFGATIRLRPVP